MASPNASSAAAQCHDGLLLPFLDETGWRWEVRGVLYLVAMMYLFLGVAIITDIFMAAIESITSKTRKVFMAKERAKKVSGRSWRRVIEALWVSGPSQRRRRTAAAPSAASDFALPGKRKTRSGSLGSLGSLGTGPAPPSRARRGGHDGETARRGSATPTRHPSHATSRRQPKRHPAATPGHALRPPRGLYKQPRLAERLSA